MPRGRLMGDSLTVTVKDRKTGKTDIKKSSSLGARTGMFDLSVKHRRKTGKAHGHTIGSINRAAKKALDKE